MNNEHKMATIAIEKKSLSGGLSGFKIIFGKEVSIKNIELALQLDYVSYDNVYYLEQERCVEYHKKNPYIYIMILNPEGNTVGYLNFSPITEELYEILRTGKEIDTIIHSEDIVCYEYGGEYSAYLSSICVHPDYRNKGIAGILLEEFGFLLESLNKSDIKIKRVIADAVSLSGEKICKSMGMNEICVSEHGTKIMEKKYE